VSLEVQNTSELLNVAISNELYKALIIQLNKDFQLSNIEEYISEVVTSDDLRRQLNVIVEHLIHNDFDSFLSLLYRIDLSEQSIQKQDNQSTETYIEYVSFLILKREWQKVWFKQNYPS
jgi:hypothetical protein